MVGDMYEKIRFSDVIVEIGTFSFEKSILTSKPEKCQFFCNKMSVFWGGGKNGDSRTKSDQLTTKHTNEHIYFMSEFRE